VAVVLGSFMIVLVVRVFVVLVFVFVVVVVAAAVKVASRSAAIWKEGRKCIFGRRGRKLELETGLWGGDGSTFWRRRWEVYDQLEMVPWEAES
jgi:hypothetical protein